MKGYFRMLVSALSLLPLVYLLLVAIPLSVIDLRERRLPNRLVFPALVLTLFCHIGLAFFDWQRVLVSFACAILVFAGMIVANNLGWVGIGMGDVKLTTALVWASTWFIGLWSIAIFPLAMILAMAFYFTAIALKFAFKGTTVPMGPWMYLSLIILLAIAH